MLYKTGVYYDIPCAEILMDDSRIYHIPVFDHLHADPQFGFPQPHYHIDGRFYMEPRMLQFFKVIDGHTSAVITEAHKGSYILQKIVLKAVLCERNATGISIPAEPDNEQKPKIEMYHNWYRKYIGQICEGRKCPHFGTQMLEKQGMLVCPMHELTADLITGIITERWCGK